MSDCKWVSSSHPRVLPGRHLDECGDGCGGCLPCTERHCRICSVAHATGACAGCMAETREALHDIARRCDALPDEASDRGINAEAMMLLAPAADPEARGHAESSYLAGRLPEGWLEASHGKKCPRLTNDACTGCAGPELHPLTVLGTWEMVWRDALEHHTDERLTLTEAVRYLDTQMTYMSGYDLVPFEDFARDLRRCLAHLESVLRDQPHGDRANVGCFECRGDLERRLTATGFEDVWTCRRCRRKYTAAEYNFALRAAIESRLEESA